HVRDAAGCVRHTLVSVTQPATLTVSIATTDVSCFGGSNGSAISTVNGGTGPYTYLWSTGAITPVVSGLIAGNYSVVVKDAAGCEATASAAINAPDSLSILAAVTKPNCDSLCNGAISVQVSGGTLPYGFQWSNGSVAANQQQLCAGTYTLTVTDANGCVRSLSITLDQPDALTADAGPDKTLCKTGTLLLRGTASNAAASYRWTSTSGISSDSSTVRIDQPGSYFLEVSRNNCVGRDTVVITQTTNDLKAEFVASSQAFKDSIFSIINISSPAPDSVRWVLPNAASVLIISQDKNLAELIFRDTGTFTVSMIVRSGECEKTVEDRIFVIEGQPFQPVAGNPRRAYIQQFTIGPNPNDGKFTVHIELEEKGPVRLRILSLDSGGTRDDSQSDGEKVYDLAYDIAIPAGQYLLLLETAQGSQSLKLTLR
ncbi:MAG: SprB repeat-containing protein, partial [Bacteroidota bacterium]